MFTCYVEPMREELGRADTGTQEIRSHPLLQLLFGRSKESGPCTLWEMKHASCQHWAVTKAQGLAPHKDFQSQLACRFKDG